ncbi:hypothetical protein HAX54_032974 [Datura stramonium]|uniref:Uncharacterized protein n=1 Tax=Datura stramonium TaxID=4076 RepID=A0ABS8VEL8_DATST|nr:hypothetical protein [Datura stramonium]
MHHRSGCSCENPVITWLLEWLRRKSQIGTSISALYINLSALICWQMTASASGSLIFPVDFVVSTLSDAAAPFILGRPFLATVKAIAAVAYKCEHMTRWRCSMCTRPPNSYCTKNSLINVLEQPSAASGTTTRTKGRAPDRGKLDEGGDVVRKRPSP